MSLTDINIADIRNDYRLAELDESSAGNDPLHFFSKWFNEAEQARITEVNAMTLATVDENNHPHARIVLLKGLDSKGFVFYTNYSSAKGQELAVNQHAAIVFFWKELERQVRIEGIIEKVSGEESDLYFQSRPEGSKIGAWASPQSQVIPDRKVLETNYHTFTEKFQKDIPRPSHWGGYRLVASKIEFWQGRSNRLHDRLVFQLGADSEWIISRLAP